MVLNSRQIHLDFHTSEHIPEVGKDFNPQEFAAVVKSGHVNSMTVFAHCHHGWLYYDSKKYPELVHPQLQNRNLLLEQVKALHEQGIKAPVYITVQWNYFAATHHPEWLIRKPGGEHEGDSFNEPGFYQSLCVNTGYKKHLEGVTQEVMDLLGDQLDGLFFDIVGIRPCWCASCREEMRTKGINTSDEQAVREFAYYTMNRFRSEMTALIRKSNKECSIFYNAGHVGTALKEGKDSFTHFELESLPSGDWGYQHFPVTAHYARKLGKDCVGMTGKFHTAWGDFHSLKNLAALEFECFRMLSYGFACSIGDQLEPNGKINPATYNRIGKVYQQVEAYEPWSRPSIPVAEVAVITSENRYFEHQMPEDLMGAVQLLEELSIQFDILDPEMDFKAYKVVILPDSLRVNTDFQRKLDSYVANGGSILATGKGGLNEKEQYPTSFGVIYESEQEKYPDFIIADGAIGQGLYASNEYVIYDQGNSLSSIGATEILYANPPYFKRQKDYFCSHLYTPSSKQNEYPVAFKKENVIVFSHPLFGQYRKCAPQWVKIMIKNAFHVLLPKQLVKHDGPSTLSVHLMDQPEQHRYVLHVLSYIPVRKSATIDIIEERTTVNDIGIKLNVDKKVSAARIVPEGVKLDIIDGSFTIPKCNGYAVVELPYE